MTLINSVIIEGMTAYKVALFSRDLASLSGKFVSIDDINRVLRNITNRYIRDGYVTSRATVGPNSLDHGKLTITVFEGQVDGIKAGQFPGDRKYGKSELWTGFGTMRGKVLNIRDLEQGVDQLSRLSSAKPTIDIRPGKIPGSGEIVACRERISRPVHIIADFDNDGQSNTGRYQATGTVIFDSPLGLGDVWQGYYSHNLGGRDDVGSEGYGLFLSIPLIYNTITLSSGRYRFHSVLQGNEFAFENTGESINASIAFDHLFYRNQKTKASATVSLAALDTTNRIQGIELLTGSYRLVNASFQLHYYRIFGIEKSSLLQTDRTSSLTVDLSYDHGLNILGANGVDIGADGPQTAFRKIEGTVAYQSGIRLSDRQFAYAGVVRGQLAFTNVFPAERMSIGGSSTVRGFRDDGISGRNGLFTRQQISTPLRSFHIIPSVFEPTDISVFLGYDAGGILPNSDDAFERGFIQSGSIGLRSRNKYISTELTLSRSISSPKFVRASRFTLVGTVRSAF